LDDTCRARRSADPRCWKALADQLAHSVPGSTETPPGRADQSAVADQRDDLLLWTSVRGCLLAWAAAATLPSKQA